MTDVPEWLAIPRPDEIYHEPVHDGPCSCDTPTRPSRSRSSTRCTLTCATSRTRVLLHTNALATVQDHRAAPVITAAAAARMHAAAAPGGICIEAVVTGHEPGLIDRIAAALFPWLTGPAEPEREAEL
jgi:hypothetical protein